MYRVGDREKRTHPHADSFRQCGQCIESRKPSPINQGESYHDSMDIGKEVAALCKQGKNQEAIDRFYSPNIESVEPVAMPGMGQTQTGIQTVKKKNQWWVDNHEIHGGTVDGPYPHGDRFILHFKYDVTPKHMGKRMTLDETGLYTVHDGKVVKEEFFYSMDSGDCVAKA